MKVLLCDDHRMMRDGLRVILEREGLDVVGEAANGREVIELVERLLPDIVVMDITMPELNGIDATRRLMDRWPGIKVLGLSMNSDRRYVIRMFAAGAVGYLLKNSAADELISAIRAVASGHKYVSPAVAGSVIDGCLAQAPPSERQSTHPPPDGTAPKPLSAREREVLQLLAEGKSSKDIAIRLDIAATTVETHRRQIMHKLNLRSIAELTKYAVREGLTSLD